MVIAQHSSGLPPLADGNVAVRNSAAQCHEETFCYAIGRLATSSASTRSWMCRLVDCPCVTQALSTGWCSYRATEIQALPEPTRRFAMSLTGADPSGGRKQRTATGELLAIVHPLSRSSSLSSPVKLTARSMCSAYPCQPAAASDRNNLRPRNRRDH